MQRILDPTQIEAFAQRAITRIRLADRADVFANRARRLRDLGQSNAIGRSIGDYLRVMATVADAQQAALAGLAAPLPDAAGIAQAHECRMPLIHAASWRRASCWRGVLEQLCDSVAAVPVFPSAVSEICAGLRGSNHAQLEAQADALLALRTEEIDAAAAPFLMASLQVYWVHLASRLDVGDVAALDVPGVCPVCGTLPVASVMRADPRSQGYRYLHCALCATEWHLPRVTCSQCQATKEVAYLSIEGGSEVISAESCDRCHTYRKILYQEKDPGVEAVADDLASLALDLMLSTEGYHRGSPNPLLWQRA